MPHNGARILGAPLRDKPAWGFGHAQHTDEKRECRQGADGEHPPPYAVVFTPEVTDDGVHNERCELPADNHEFVTPGE